MNSKSIQSNLKVNNCFKNPENGDTLIIKIIDDSEDGVIYYNFKENPFPKDFKCTKNEFIKWIEKVNAEIIVENQSVC